MEWVGRGREINEKHDDDCCEEGFRLARVILGRDSEEGSEGIEWGAVV